MEQQYLLELSVSYSFFSDGVEAKLKKIPVEEKAKSYRVLQGCAIARQFIKKDEILNVFEKSFYSPTIYGTKEEDIPQMFKELKRVIDMQKLKMEYEVKRLANMLGAVSVLEDDN